LQEALTADAILSNRASTPRDYFQVVVPPPVDRFEKRSSVYNVDCDFKPVGEHVGFLFPAIGTEMHAYAGGLVSHVRPITTLTLLDNCSAVSSAQNANHVFDLVGGKSFNLDQYATAALTGQTPNQRSTISTINRYLALLAARNNAISAESYGGLVRQLRAILSDEDELRSHSIKPRVESFEGLINFLSTRRPKHPNLSINRDGYFVASWSPATMSKLTLTFKSENGGGWVGVNLTDPRSRGSGPFAIAHVVLPEPFTDWM
jgi:hypothetical protein